MRKSNRLAVCLLPLLLLSATAACSVTTGQETPGQFVDSAALTTKVKSKLAAEGGMDLFSQVKVTTVEQVVQLSGFVKKATAKAQAEQIAWSVDGVHSVRNDIEIHP